MGKTNTQAQENAQAQALETARDSAIKAMDEMTKIEFMSSCNIDVKDAGKAGIKPVYTMTYVDKDKDGNEIVSRNEVTDPDVVADLVRLDKLTQAGQQAGIGMCYILSKLAEKKDLLHVKSMDEFGKLYGARYGIQSKTASQYARVGKYFVCMQDNGNGANYYLRPEVAGASRTNLVQVLSLTDDSLDDPCQPLWDLLAENKIHLDGTLTRLKDEIKKLKGIEDKSANNGEGEGAGAGKKGNASKIDYTQALSVLLEKANGIEDTEAKTDALTAIAKLEAIFNAIEKAQAQAGEGEGENA